MMETTSNSTRIVFECRDAGAIAEPILSRSTLFAVNAPDPTEIYYELMRRTDFKVSKTAVDQIVQTCDGNMRKGLLKTLTVLWFGDIASKMNDDEDQYNSILRKRPVGKAGSDEEWITWATESEQTCRLQGLDLRDLLGRGWKNNHHVSYMNSQWPRLGGVSPKALFFNCVHLLKDCPYS
jgi:hypothetical protein